MAKRQDRILVLLDTSVLVRIWANPRSESHSAQIWRLWLERRIQLAVSFELVREYAEVLERLSYPSERIQEFVNRLETRKTVKRVNLGKRVRLERDPNDEPILSTANAARVEYLITLDKDLLEMSPAERRSLRFEIVTPTQFLMRLERELV